MNTDEKLRMEYPHTNRNDGAKYQCIMQNPYIGRDGHDYYTFDALRQANAEYRRQMYQNK